MAEKLNRKELRKPDEFQIVAGRVMEWTRPRQLQIVGIVGAIVVISFATWGFNAYQNAREARAGEALAEAVGIESRPLAGEAYLPPGIETFPSKEERTKAALVALEKGRADAPTTRASNTALAEIGFVKQKAGDSAGAAQALREFLSQSARGMPLRVFATESLAYALEAQGKLDEARSAFGQLAEEGAPDRAAFQQARVALVEGKPEAKQLLGEVAQKYSKDPVALEAQRRIELAGLPPPPPPGTQPTAGAASAEAKVKVKKDLKAPKPIAKKK
ncbi:MAG TPA: hypothetical protein VN874_08550 [Myxococcales bacterium]|nr:hypothetical protein [Myxococcales bacterium]